MVVGDQILQFLQDPDLVVVEMVQMVDLTAELEQLTQAAVEVDLLIILMALTVAVEDQE